MPDPLSEWFRWLHDAQGINLTIFYDPIDGQKFLRGMWTTMELSAASVVLSTLVGIVGAWLQQSSLVWTRRLVQVYIQFFRNTPPLVQLYFFYFALDNAVAKLIGAHNIMGSFGWALIALSFFAGAFNIEIFRAGIEAIPRSTVEAAEALGYTRLGIYRHVVLPLAFRISLPAFNNNLVNLVKTTTIAYAIATPETLYMANQIWSDNVNVREMMNVVWVFYLALVGVLVWLMGRWERAMRVPGLGQ
jgi:polar amino acid transport system permease protein